MKSRSAPKHPRAAISRRALLGGLAATAGIAALAPQEARAMRTERKPPRGRRDVIVIGAGVFGAWTAWHLRRTGKRVLLIDAWGPAHARASSGGESRMTRTAYGQDEIYTRFAWESLEDWRWLSGVAGPPIFHPMGVVFFFPRMQAYVAQTIEVHKRLRIPLDVLDRATLAARFPQIAWEGVELGLFEPGRGALMARRAVQTLVREFVKAGGDYRKAAAAPQRDERTFTGLITLDGETFAAEQYVFACGAWLPKLFPQVLGERIFPTRQEVFYFSPDAGDARFESAHLPGWADFNEGDIYYGFPDLESRGFKIAHDLHGPPIDPDAGDRVASAAALADVRAFMARRFPTLARAPLVESRVCQYENSSNGDLLIDRHPAWRNVWFAGAGSGHGFKHGPAVGRYIARLLSGERFDVEARFSLQSKRAQQHRGVH